ncbi:hypothetical protein PGB90_006597 [Kerria lacca]
MSLFPAYSSEKPSKISEDNDHNWLIINSSSEDIQAFKEQVNTSSSTEELSTSKTKKKKKQQYDTKNEERKLELQFQQAQEKMVELVSSDSSFHVDRTGSKNNFLIPTLMKNDVPIYNKPKKYYQNDNSKRRNKILKWRYFNRSKKIYDADEKILEHLPTQTNENYLLINNTDTVSLIQHLELKLTEKTASYNRQLTEDPHNEELWLEFVNFQDKKIEFEKRYRKMKNDSQNTEERKLSILDKALSHNPLSESLLYCKFDVMCKLYDPDKLSNEIFSALRQDFGNTNLWIRYINITQSTLSRCRVSEVISLYAKAMEKINFMQKYGILATELQLLELFTFSAFFLRQCGLWEQLCTLIRLNLQLNISTSEVENYKVKVLIPDEKIKELEDEILCSGLPICSLWLRLEKIRQRVHWYPVLDDECEDPQRIVLPTDVSDLIRPISTNSLNLRITIITMYLLKVPLMPLRDVVYRSLALNTIPWHLDSAEILLSAFCSMGITEGRSVNHEESIITCLKDLVSYPQYFNDELGQLEYLEFLQNMFKKISQNLPLNLETIIIVWWLRFERTLLIAGKQPVFRKKRLKSSVKDLLKEERHRNNLSLFIEYALLERELNKNDFSCIKILETALLMYPLKKSMFHTSTIKNSLTHLYRVLVEILLFGGNKEKCVRLLISMALSVPENEIKINKDSIKTALIKFQKITDDEMSQDYFLDDFELVHIEPQFFVEWVYCQAWFLYLTESVSSTVSFLDEIISKLPYYVEDKQITRNVYFRELITEIKIIIMHFHCNTNKCAFGILNNHLKQAISEFPNNMCFLCTLCDLETKLNFVSPWWKIEKCLRSNDSQLAKLIMILLCRRRLIFYEKARIASIEILNKGGPVCVPSGFNNRMKALLRKLVYDDSSRQCPLIWMIYLQYCMQYETEVKCKDVFFMAIENCPWIKTLYMEGAHALPDQVSQIQDLMIEKEMRIHITQDEIEILRD